MGRGRSRKQRNSATFRLCPHPGGADASDRVVVRIDANPYSVPGFADEDRDYGGVGVGPSSSAVAAAGEDPLPEHVRREILDLGLPDDGYLREIRPSISSTGGGGSSAAFLPARLPARSGLPLNVKAYDARGVGAGPDEVGAAALAVSPVEEATDLDVAELLQESDAPPPGASEDDDLEDDFVIIASQPEEEEQMDVEEDFVILASQREEEGQVDVEEEERLEDAGSDEVPLTDDQIEMIKLLHQLLRSWKIINNVMVSAQPCQKKRIMY